MSAGLRTGFIMRSFIPLGPLTVSRGLGGWGTEIIEVELEEELIAGRRPTRVSALDHRAPLTLLRRRKEEGS